MSRGEASAAIRVVTWNIHGGVGADRRCDLDRVATVIASLAPDILALQEVDGRAWAGRRPGAFERLAALLGGHVAEARLTGRGEGAYGHLLWSRWPLGEVAVRRLPGGRIEPRAVIDAVAETPLGRLRVLATHFGLAPGDRKRQSAFLAALPAERELPTVALGDFNDWRRNGSVARFLGAALPNVASLPTWPARRPFVPMDRIYASAGIPLAPVSIDLTLEARARRSSDHLPLAAMLALR
ncbi:endonuclease/exonuclease/phosphatase family protein [Aureimonas leprariae]|uniref:Endonuclease n=1 Tax=Plantimonas leprariae TaxID=2615207 RepID=A0A7V7PQ39_9HYPH|nr:endonuclease/exonuclease/phosphatase family protein [Aureimonas leprariae]KAB0680212.1 endonuclease [Aureimonas leprariae]